MSTHSLRPIRATRIATLAVALVAVAAAAAAQSRRSGRRVTPDQAFGTVWVVDRTMPEPAVWQTLVDVTSGDDFQPVVLHSGDDERWTTSLVHMLELLPRGEVVWASDRGTVFDVDDVVHPADLGHDGAGPAVYSADAGLDPVAALIAMRTHGELVFEPPDPRKAAILVGVERPPRARLADAYLPSWDDALAYANMLATRSVVMVVAAGTVLPEHFLWAYQRGAKVLQVDPPPYGIEDAWSEFLAVGEVSRQIRAGVGELLGGELPEALVIAGDWEEIPFRYPYGIGAASASQGSTGYPGPCPGCDNGVHEFAADLIYANLDGDPWDVPDVPVGRFMSPYRDLLAIQTAVGVWAEHGGFPPASDGVFLGLLGTEAPVRRAAADAWRDAFPGRLWSVIGPAGIDRDYRLDRDAFFEVADRADIVVVHGHGHPDVISPDGNPFHQAFTGTHLLHRSTTAVPAFWFLHACGTGKPDLADRNPDQTLLVGLQSRLAFGALMAVENTSSASSDPYWWSGSVEPGVAVGELVRRFAAAAAGAYRDGDAVAEGLPGTAGSDDNKRFNSRGVMSWVGDPLTKIRSAD